MNIDMSKRLLPESGIGVKILLPVCLVALAVISALPALASDSSAFMHALSATDATTDREFVLIKSGCFMMGDTVGDGEEDEKPLHEVCVDPFYLARHEVTVGQFRQFVHETGYRTDAERSAGGKSGCESFDRDDKEHFWAWRSWANWMRPNKYQETLDSHPVVCVSWRDADAYAQWLSRKTGRSYRLPTEAEWEYAARGGTGTRAHWGNDKDAACLYANVADQTPIPPLNRKWLRRHDCTDGHAFVAPVGMLQPNAYGLFDMMGNVWEWCADGYDKEYYKKSPRNNPLAAATGEEYPLHVLRGASWDYGRDDIRVAYRYGYASVNRCVNSGFRLARTP